MEDYRIVDLYWERNEAAITESDRKYGKMLKSLSYSLLSSREDAEELGRLLKRAFAGTGAPIHVNLIRVNEVKETGLKKGSEESAKEFGDRLSDFGIVATLRRRLGADVNAACGQLRRSSMQNKPSN